MNIGSPSTTRQRRNYTPLPACTPLPTAVTLHTGLAGDVSGSLLQIDASAGNPYLIQIDRPGAEPTWYRRHKFTIAN